jgi:anti-sigma B factor antagonist
MLRPELTLRDGSRNGGRTLALAGEPDMATAPQLTEAVVRVCAEGPEQLLLDLRALRFVDTTGLRALLSASEVCERHQCRLILTRALPSIERMFEVTGAVEVLPFMARGEQPVADEAARSHVTR